MFLLSHYAITPWLFAIIILRLLLHALTCHYAITPLSNIFISTPLILMPLIFLRLITIADADYWLFSFAPYCHDAISIITSHWFHFIDAVISLIIVIFNDAITGWLCRLFDYYWPLLSFLFDMPRHFHYYFTYHHHWRYYLLIQALSRLSLLIIRFYRYAIIIIINTPFPLIE